MRERRIAGDRGAERPAVQNYSRQFAADVFYYLSLNPRQLPSRYLYDPLGSALFDAICRLPWYRITAAELRLLDAHAAAIAEAPFARIVELGPGSGEKLLTLLESAELDRQVEVHLVDISSSALDLAARALRHLSSVRLVRHEATYEAGLDAAARSRSGGRTLALFLGSNIGNFDPPGADAFLRSIRASLRRGDAFLLGADLVKPEADLLRAYDDPLGVTAAFNRNLLVRINRELGGTFDLDGFRHCAVWNGAESRVEMHLVSRHTQSVAISAADLEITFHPGETIWTESSYKYDSAQLVRMLRAAGFVPLQQWIDEGDRFALTLVRAE